MKKLRLALITILCLLSAFSFSLSVSADEVKFYIEPLKMTIRIPDSMAVKTKDNSTDLEEDIYLEAINQDDTLKIAISMISDEKTLEAKSFTDMPSSALRKYKENIEADGYSAGADGNYGGVPFLDFSKKTKSDTDIDVYVRQSITIVNGMGISVISYSLGDNFTSDELSLIKGCLESIRFDNLGVAEKKVTFWGVVLWVFIIIIILAIGFILLSFYMGKRNAQRKRAMKEEKSKKANYDVLKNADINNKKRENAQKLAGYKTSADYFDNDFDSSKIVSTDSSGLTPKAAPSTAQKAVKSTKATVTHMGYFFKNLKKEMNKNKGSKGKKSSKKSKARVRDYDIFNEK